MAEERLHEVGSVCIPHTLLSNCLSKPSVPSKVPMRVLCKLRSSELKRCRQCAVKVARGSLPKLWPSKFNHSNLGEYKSVAGTSLSGSQSAGPGPCHLGGLRSPGPVGSWAPGFLSDDNWPCGSHQMRSTPLS